MITTLDLKKIGIKTAYSYLEKNPEKNMLKLMDWVDHFAGSGPDSFEEQRAIIRQIAADPDSNWHQLVMRILRDTDCEVVKTVFTNFFLNAVLTGWKTLEENRRNYPVQHSLDHPAGSHFGLQFALNRLLGGRIRQ